MTTIGSGATAPASTQSSFGDRLDSWDPKSYTEAAEFGAIVGGGVLGFLSGGVALLASNEMVEPGTNIGRFQTAGEGIRFAGKVGGSVALIGGALGALVAVDVLHEQRT